MTTIQSRSGLYLSTGAAVLILTLALTACGGGGGGGGGSGAISPEIPLASIAVSPEAVTLPVGLFRQFTATGNFEDGSSQDITDSVTWSWDNPALASVDSTGKAQALAVGVVTVIATDPTSTISGSATMNIDTVYSAEGTTAAPIDLTGSFPYVGQVDTTNSHYVATGLTPGAAYTITITDMSDAFRVSVRDDPFAGTPLCFTSVPGAVDKLCTAPANINGELYLVVEGSRTTAGGFFTLQVIAGGILAEGSRTAPVDITGMLPYSGQVNTDHSYYIVKGLLPGAAYITSVTGVSDDVDLQVYPNSSFATDTSCTSSMLGTVDESCPAAATADGILYIRIAGEFTAAGATFTIDVAQGGSINEGTAIDPVNITGLLPYGGSVGINTSYYLVTGLTANSAYTVNLTGPSDSVKFFVFSAPLFNGRTSLECSSNFTSADQSCVAKSNSFGELYIQVLGLASVAGAMFTLDLVPGGIVKEGYFAAPLDLTGILPHSGSVNTDRSFYVVKGLAPSSPFTVTLTDLSDNADLFVHSDAFITSEECISSNLGTLDETCAVNANPSGELFLIISGDTTTAGATYTVDVQ